MEKKMEFSEARIADSLAEIYDPDLPPESPYPAEFSKQVFYPAAVLLPLFLQDNNWHLLFIRRTYIESDRHKGQVAFPGGRFGPQDKNAEQAALREAYEETGVLPTDVKILGRLRDMLTITGFCVTPIVGVIPWPYSLKRQQSEVSRIFSIPLNWLIDSSNRFVENREIHILGKSVPVIYYKPFDGEILWGASARITLLLLEALGLSSLDEGYKQ
jgi:8-oxo-dGTP pyrophosphatase MutT (NUDIX family)